MAIEYEYPSKELIKLLRDGLVAFYPDEVRGVFGLGTTRLPFHESWGGYTRFEFVDLALDATQTNDVKAAAAVIRSWEQGKNLTETIPSNINDLVTDYEREKAADIKRRAAKETLLAAQKAKEEKVTEAVTPGEPAKEVVQEAPEKIKKEEVKTPDEPLVQGEAVAVKSAETAAVPEAIGINIKYAKTDVGGGFRAQSRTAPTRWIIAHSYEKMRATDPEKAAAISMWAHGITSAHVEPKIKDLPDKHAQQLEKIVNAIKGLETDSIETALLRQSFPIEDINFVLGPEGVTQSEMMAFFYPPEQGGVYIPQQTSFMGNIAWSIAQQFATKAITKQVTGLLVKAGTKVAVKGGVQAATTAATTAGTGAATAATGAAVGGGAAATGAAAGTAIPIPIVGTLIGLVVGLIVGALFSVAEKLTQWLKKNARDLLFGGVAMLAYGGLVGSPALMLGGLGIGGLSALSGGLKGAGKQAGGLGSTVIGGMTTTMIPAVGLPFLGALIAVPVIIAVILVIINSGAYVVPPTPFASMGPGIPINCTDEKGPISFGNNNLSPISTRAWEIAADLYQGFWCFWNRPPSSPPRPDFPKDVVLYPPTYPGLFDYERFKRDPNPSYLNDCGDCLFWCTYLVVKSYHENGNHSFQLTLWAPTMYDDWNRRGKLIPGARAAPNNIKPGSVVFFHVAGGHSSANHVAIVHSVNRDAIMYVQSNAGTKDGHIEFKSGGVGVISPPGFEVLGFGLP